MESDSSGRLARIGAAMDAVRTRKECGTRSRRDANRNLWLLMVIWPIGFSVSPFALVIAETAVIFGSALDSPVLAAVIAGAFTTLNTILALLLARAWERRGPRKGSRFDRRTGRRGSRRRRGASRQRHGDTD